MSWQWNVIICSDLCLILYIVFILLFTILFNRKTKIRQKQVNMYLYVQIIGKSFETLLKDPQKKPIFSLL